MRLRLSFILVLVVGASMPLFAHAASLFGPIIPQTGACTCADSAPDWGCILQVVQNVMNAAIGIAIIIVVLAIAYTGFLLMTRGGNPSARTQARNVVLNSLVGLAVLLGAWIGVDFVIKAVYNPQAVFSGNIDLGPWNEILAGNGDDLCIRPRAQQPLTEGEVAIAIQQGRLQGGAGACSPANVLAAASQGGVTMDPSEAAVIACFAGPESSCGTNMENYNWDGRRDPAHPSTAYGAFQILLSTNSRCFETPACYEAAHVSGPLNCASGFRNGRPIPNSPIVQQCRNAAANLACSAVAAHCVYQSQGAGAWSNNRDSTAAHQACTIRGR